MTSPISMQYSMPSQSCEEIGRKVPKIVGFSLDRLSLSFAADSEFQISRLKSIDELKLSENIKLVQVRSADSFYQGPSFSGNGIRIFSSASQQKPVRIEISGKGCRQYTHDELIDIIDELERKIGLTGCLVSHCDLALDIAHYNFEKSGQKNFFTKLNKFHTFSDSKTGRVEGFVWGSRKRNQVRIYNKTKELALRGLSPKVLYPELGDDDTLWRIEASLCRDYLREFQINSPSLLFKNIASLMKIAMTKLVYMRGRNGKTSRQWIEWRELLCDAPTLKREIPETRFDESRSYRAVIGYLTSLAVYKKFQTFEETIEYLKTNPGLEFHWKRSLNKKTNSRE